MLDSFHSLTDKVLVFGTSDGGSIPPGSTVKVTKYFLFYFYSVNTL